MRKPFGQLFDSANNQILDPLGLAHEMFDGQREDAGPQAGGARRPPSDGGGRRSIVSFFQPRIAGDMNTPFSMAQSITGQQGAHLGGVIGRVQQALGDEHDSRVAQERERRRMEHEKELMRMRMEAQKRADESALIRSLLADM